MPARVFPTLPLAQPSLGLGKATVGASTLVLLLLSGCPNQPDPSTFNCGRVGPGDWQAPDGCTCHGPHGETQWRPPVPEGEVSELVDITCEDRRLQPCPSTSGVGCYLEIEPDFPISEEDPVLIDLHFDIGGHVHDMCCGALFGLPDAAGFTEGCNGCAALSPGLREHRCEGAPTLASVVTGRPVNPEKPCAAEWTYALKAGLRPEFRWRSTADTEVRFTPPQVVERNMGYSGRDYTQTDAEPPVPFGAALAPSELNPFEQRAPSGQALGTSALSDPFDPVNGSLGMSATSIGSFCQSGSAAYDASDDVWRCL